MATRAARARGRARRPEAGCQRRRLGAARAAHALVLDNCEHLLDGVADFVTSVMASVPDLRVLVTSQEALKTSQEHVRSGRHARRPGISSGRRAADRERSPRARRSALRRRARAVDPRFQLSAANVDAVVEICRCLDGIPSPSSSRRACRCLASRA